MDVHDVSTEDQFTSTLLKQKQTLVDSKKRDGELPTDRKSKEQLVANFRMDQQSARFVPNDMRHMVQSSFVPPPYLPSITPCAQLQPIYIKELRLGQSHRGKCLIVRSLTVPTRMTGLLAVVEDEIGDASLLQLYQ
jgi:hypothetical protein